MENTTETEEKLLFNINNQNISIEETICPHIYKHFLNPYMNYKFKKVKIENNSFFSKNLSIHQSLFKTFNFCGYNQSRNILDSFLLKNLSYDWIALNQTQNLNNNMINKEGCIFSLSFNDTGNLMSCSNHINTLEIWDMKNQKMKQSILSHTEIVTDTQFFHGSQDNEYFLSCSLDKTIKLYKDFKPIHTFLDHSDWVKCISIRNDNSQFLSGCISSVVKLWDLPTQRVIGCIMNNEDQENKQIKTINSLNFLNNNPNIFIIGLRSGEIKICDSRIQTKNNEHIKNVGIVQTFLAHKKKLNTVKLNHNDKYILSSGRDSNLFLWDLRKISSKVNEYNRHKCVGYNIECSFYLNEKYVMTGSEDGNIYIYDIFDNKKFYKYPTKLRSVNLIKQIPHCNSIAFTGLENLSVFIWSPNKKNAKIYENEIDDNQMEKDDEDDNVDKGQQILNSIAEEVFSDCGDSILQIMHSHNWTTNNGVNLEEITNLLNRSNDENMVNLLQKLKEKLIQKLIQNFKNLYTKKDQDVQSNKTEKEKIVQKIDIKCLDCEKKQKNTNKTINNCQNLAKFLEHLPNNFGFNQLNELI